MRTKNFTFLTLALLMMSVVAFAQKKAPTNEASTAQQKELRAMALAKEKFGAFDFNHKVLPQFVQKTKKVNVPASLKAKVNPMLKKSPKQAQSQIMAQERATSTVKAENLLSPSWGMGSFTTSRIGKRTAPDDALFFDDFESGDLSNWTLKTLNEGDGWMPGTPAAYGICDAHSGTYVASSWSWNNRSYNVDNWLITPKVALGGSVVFWTYTHASYPDKYEVLLSTTGTETTDFTVTLRELSADAGSAWEQKVIDLSAYAGQEGYIAIHHQDYDMNYLFIDDFAVTENAYVAPVDPSTLPAIDATFAAYFTNNSGTTPVERTIKIAIDGTDVYIQGISYYIPKAWIKGTIGAGGITLESGQLYGTYSGTMLYFALFDTETEAWKNEVTVPFDIMSGTLTWPDNIFILENGSATELSWYGYYEVVAATAAPGPDIQTPPDGVEANLVEYQLVETQALNYEGSTIDYTLPIFIGQDGNDVWVKGVCQDLPDRWIKGTRNGNTVTFPTNQLFYALDYTEFGYGIIKAFFAGLDATNYALADVTMTIDSSTGVYTMTSPDYMLINAAWLVVDPNVYLQGVQFVPVPDVAATPAQPEITAATLTGSYPNITVNIPLEDTEGNAIQSSKLSYQYYYEIDHVANPLTLYPSDYSHLTEAMSEIPYSFVDDGVQGEDIWNEKLYLNMDFSTWNRIGIQSIYRGGGDEHASEIFWYVINPYSFVVTFSGTIPNTIENGFATVTVDGTDATLDADSKLTVQSGSEVAIKVKKDYKFDQISASDGTTITTDANATNASFTMPENDVTISYSIREIGKNIKFATDGEFSIQNGQATVEVNGSDVTDVISASGTLQDVPAGSQVELATLPGYKFSNVSATYVQPAGGGGGGGASSDLTVYDGSASNGYVPVYGFYADAYLKSEFVMPASELAAMAGSDINSLKFYAQQSSVNWGAAQFQVFLTEVADATISAFNGPGTIVYEGALSIDGGEMNVEFTTPYHYNGGNLLIGFYLTEQGTYVTSTWVGEAVDGASVQGYNYTSLDAISPTQRNFLPKTTFTYSAGGGAAVDVQIGEGDQTNSYLPFYTLYNYSLTQQIYTVEEIAAAGGSPGNINSIAFNAQTERTRNIDIYLVHTRKDAFADNTDWIAVTASDKVFSGEVTFAAGDWTTITFDTPFNYNGVDNLAVIVDDNTGSWISGGSFKVYDAAGQAIRVYSDETNYDPENPAYNGTRMDVKDQIILNMQTGGGAPEPVAIEDLTVTPDNISFTMPNGNVTLNYTIEHPGTEITVPAGAYITYYTDKAIMTYDTDVQLMTVSSVTDNAVNVTEETVVPNETPMLIYNGTGADKTVWLSYADELGITVGTVTTAAEFKGTLDAKTFTEDEMAAKDYYVCTGQNFVWVRTAGTIGANKCWIELTKNAPKNARPIVLDGEATGIDTVVKGSALENGVWYDLNGRRLQGAPTQKGVYVINGKKVVIK